MQSGRNSAVSAPVLGVLPETESAAAARELRGLAWMARSAFLYAFAAMIASAADVGLLIVVTSFERYPITANTFDLMVLVSIVRNTAWLLGYPAVVLLFVGLYAFERSTGNPGIGLRLEWPLFALGVGLCVVTVALWLWFPVRWQNEADALLRVGTGLGSAMALLIAAALPALWRAPRCWRSPARVAVLLGSVAAVLEAVAFAASWALNGRTPFWIGWPPLTWGFPASFGVLASAALLWWSYSSLRKAANLSLRSGGNPPPA